MINWKYVYAESNYKLASRWEYGSIVQRRLNNFAQCLRIAGIEYARECYLRKVFRHGAGNE